MLKFTPRIEELESRCVPSNNCICNANLCNSTTPQNIYYTVNGQVEKTLYGRIDIPSGATVGVYFTLTQPGTYSLSSYTAPNGTLNTYNLDNQWIYGGISITVGAGPHHLQITLPSCGYFQVDFYKGCLVNNWNQCEMQNWTDWSGIDGYFGGSDSQNCFNNDCFYQHQDACDYLYSCLMNQKEHQQCW